MGLFTKNKDAGTGTLLWFARGEDNSQQPAVQPWTVPVVVGVIETLAAACDSVPIFVRRGGELTDAHPALDLLRRPHPLANVGLLYFMSMLWDGYGEVLLMLERGPRGQLTIWPLEPFHVVTWPSRAGEQWIINTREGQKVVPQEDMIRVSRPFLGSLYRGNGWLVEALKDEFEMLEALTRYLRNWFTNNGIPPLIVSAQGMDEDQIARYEQRWLEKARGFARRLVPFFVKGKPEIIKLENTPPGELPAFYRTFRDAIFQAFGIPPEIMGVVENSNRATAEAASAIFYEYRVLPRVRTFVHALQDGLVRRVWSDATLVVGKAGPEDKQTQIEMLTKNEWIATVNEHRAAAGLPPREDGDVVLSTKPMMEV